MYVDERTISRPAYLGYMVTMVDASINLTPEDEDVEGEDGPGESFMRIHASDIIYYFAKWLYRWHDSEF